MKTKPRLLIIEDDDLQYEIYEETLSAYELVRVRKGSEALAVLAESPPELLVLDHILEDGERGLDFLPEFRKCCRMCPSSSSRARWKCGSNSPRCKGRAARITVCRNRWTSGN